jgi:16S rRNA processing protein RimM
LTRGEATGRQRPAWLSVARIVKTQGRRGEVAAEILTDFPERLLERHQVWLWDGRSEPRPVRVEKTWPHKNYLVFHFSGYESISAANELVGLEIQIPRAEATRPAGTFLLDELVGCRVFDQGSGAEFGRVRELIPTGGTEVLAVETAEGKELLIPFAEEYCRRIAPEEERIEVVLPEDLQNLNP